MSRLDIIREGIRAHEKWILTEGSDIRDGTAPIQKYIRACEQGRTLLTIVDALQAQIDWYELEYDLAEMTVEQKERWANCQVED